MLSTDVQPTLTTGEYTPLVVPVSTMSRVPSVRVDSPPCSGVGIGPAPAGLLPPPQPPPPGTRRVSFAQVPRRPDPQPKATPLVSVGVYIVMVCRWTDHILARNPLLQVEADLS